LKSDVADLGFDPPKNGLAHLLPQGSHYCYLSLFDHEVEHRVAAFSARVLGRHLSPSDMGTFGFCLEPCAVPESGVSR
jgi:hypothetical protein